VVETSDQAVPESSKGKGHEMTDGCQNTSDCECSDCDNFRAGYDSGWEEGYEACLDALEKEGALK
jgi:hypothetical protein